MSRLTLPVGLPPHFNWSRVAAISSALFLHSAAIVLLLAPVAPPYLQAKTPDSAPVVVTFVTESLPVAVEPVKPPPPRVRQKTPRPRAPTTSLPEALPLPSNDTPIASQPTPDTTEPITSTSPPTEVASSTLRYANVTKIAYPNESRRHHEQGAVLLRVLVGSDGIPQQIEVEKSSGYPRLDQAARQAVQKWRFQPAMQNGVEQSVWGLVPVNFQLNEI